MLTKLSGAGVTLHADSQAFYNYILTQSYDPP